MLAGDQKSPLDPQKASQHIDGVKTKAKDLRGKNIFAPYRPV
jgi:hypothetical protein